jgi:MYXO-CTERM domain-containing protein
MVSATVFVSPAKDQDYVVTLSDIAGEGTLGFTIAPGTAVDAAGNLAEGSSTTVSVTVGTTMPLTAWPAAVALLALGAALARRRR